MLKKDIRTELIALERKVLLLVSEHKRAKEEIVSLKSENESLRDELKRKVEQVGNFQNNLKITKIVDSMVVHKQNPTELKQVINEYIKEIDKCIAQLSQ
jgi:capsule polysaccharide export protein KpsE/RkpR